MANQGEQDIREFNRVYKELEDRYHDIACGLGISDSAFTIFCIIAELGDGCLQKDICYQAYANKQTINSSTRKLEREGYLYLEAGTGRDKHIRLTDKGKTFVRDKILPVITMEDEAFLALDEKERTEFLRLSKKYVENFKEREKAFKQTLLLLQDKQKE